MEIVIPELDEGDNQPVTYGQTSFWGATTPSAVATPRGLPPLRNPFGAAFEAHTDMRRKGSAQTQTSGSSLHSRTRSQASAGYSGHQAKLSSGGLSEASVGSSGASHGHKGGYGSSGSQSSARHSVPESAAAAEMALYIVLENFLERAEQKIGEALGRPFDQDVNLPAIFGEGVDATFDEVFVSIARVSRRLPKQVIDTVMRWRKAQNEGLDPQAMQRAMFVTAFCSAHARSALAPNPVAARAIADALNERKSVRLVASAPA